jgi:hypothetical protein
MNCRQTCFGIACALGLASCGTAFAASSLSDPLTSFNGATFSVSAADPVVYDASGAHFGTGIAGDGGRSYQRTVSSNYVQAQSFVAEITFETTTDDQAVFIGLGAGETALFGTPDWSTQLSSASFWPETANDKYVRFRTANDVNSFGDSTVAGGLDPGIHRFRMTYNRSTAQLLGEIDKNYAGGPFVADAVGTNFPIVTTSLNSPDGWLKGLLSEPSRIFFGGDDGTTFRDLSITVVPEPATAVILLMSFATMICQRIR